MQIEEIKVHKPIHQIFNHFKDYENAVFLDSSLKGELGVFSIIGLYPYLCVTKKDKTTKINGANSSVPFELFIKQYLNENKSINKTHLPIVSGAIGYFSYDYSMKMLFNSKHKDRLDVVDALLCFYDVFIIEEHKTNKLYIVANGKIKDEKTTIEKIKNVILNDVNQKPSVLKKENIKIIEDFSKEDYMKAIDKMIFHIIEGDIYVVNMTEQFRVLSNKPPYDVFTTLRKISPSPFGSYMNYESFKIICSSPERFIKIKDGFITTRPIKGTRKRGETEDEDKKLKLELENSEKDKSELLMIVDLERNDLNKICVPGSVVVKDLFHCETYSQVFHLVAQVSGKLQDDKDIMDALFAMFPGGSITGTPKLSAMKLIDKIENSLRNIYTGTIGYVGLDGSCDLNIVIRTAIFQNGMYHIGAGGGITFESDKEAEHEEVLQKAHALFASIK